MAFGYGFRPPVKSPDIYQVISHAAIQEGLARICLVDQATLRCRNGCVEIRRGEALTFHLLILSYDHAYFIFHQRAVVLLVLPPRQRPQNSCSFGPGRLDDSESIAVFESPKLLVESFDPLLPVLAGHGILEFLGGAVGVYVRVKTFEPESTVGSPSEVRLLFPCSYFRSSNRSVL